MRDNVQSFFFGISRFIENPNDIRLLRIQDQIKRSNQVPFTDMRSKVRNNDNIISGVGQFKVYLGHQKIVVSQLYYHLFVANIASGYSWVSYFHCVHIFYSVLIPVSTI